MKQAIGRDDPLYGLMGPCIVRSHNVLPNLDAVTCDALLDTGYGSAQTTVGRGVAVTGTERRSSEDVATCENGRGNEAP